MKFLFYLKVKTYIHSPIHTLHQSTQHRREANDRHHRSTGLHTGCVHDRNRRNGTRCRKSLWDIQIHRPQRSATTVAKMQSLTLCTSTEGFRPKQNGTTHSWRNGNEKDVQRYMTMPGKTPGIFDGFTNHPHLAPGFPVARWVGLYNNLGDL